MIYIKVNDTLYPATINGQNADYAWDNRESKTIMLNMAYAEVVELLPDNTPWSIVMTTQTPKVDDEGKSVLDEDGNPVMEETTAVYDNSAYSMSGPITDNRDGSCSIKMGKPTDLEEAYEMLIGGDAE